MIPPVLLYGGPGHGELVQGRGWGDSIVYASADMLRPWHDDRPVGDAVTLTRYIPRPVATPDDVVYVATRPDHPEDLDEVVGILVLVRLIARLPFIGIR